MSEYSKQLGDIVRSARKKLGLIQEEVAAQANIDKRTVLNIENYRGNPKLDVLFPLVRVLKIDPREIFYPEEEIRFPSVQQLRMTIEDCSEEEAEAVLPVLQAVLSMLRNKK